MNIYLDGKVIKNRDILFKELKEQINSEEFTGSNLDALHDVLSYTNEEVQITILNEGLLRENLGNYANGLFIVLESLKEKKHIQFNH